jgi:type IV secretory pathway VirB9-like protein
MTIPTRLAALVLSTLTLVPSLFAAEARTVRYGPRDIVDINCRIRNSTLILLPAGEKLLDLVIGDRDMWILEGTDRYAYVKPTQVGSSTTINLIAESGNVYTFLAREVSKNPEATPDIKVFVELSDPSQFHPLAAGPRYVPAAEAEALRARLASQAEQAAKDREEFAAEYPTRIAFDYMYKRDERPFKVAAIWHDDKSTYIRCRASEKPALYSVTDHQPTLIEYEVRGDVYVVPKVVDRGRLILGKKKFDFVRRGY